MRTAGERVGLMMENDARGEMGREEVKDKTLAGSRWGTLCLALMDLRYAANRC